MRSADAIPPTGSRVSRSAPPRRSRCWVTALVLIALVVAALPQPMPAVARPDPAQTPLPTTIPDAAEIPLDPTVPAGERPGNGEASAAPTGPAPDGAPAATLAPATDAPVDSPADGESSAPAASPADSDPAAVPGTTDDELLVTAADATLRLVCQLVLRATDRTPPAGTGIGDPLPDPVAGAAFSISVGGGSITLLTDSTGVLNLHPELLANADLAVATGDTVTVTQVATRSGLTLGEPSFAMTFAWQTTFSPTCRVEAFVVNPVAAAPPSTAPSASEIGPASPSTGPSLAPSTTPSPSPPVSASPSPSPIASTIPTDPVVTATTVPTATSLPTIPAGFGQIEVIVVARPSPGASPGTPQTRLAGARLIIVNRTGRVLTATMTTGLDGSALSPLLTVGTYDLILDNPPVGYLGAQAQGFDIASPTRQHVVFQLEINTTPTPPPSPSPSPSASPSAPPATATVRPSTTPRASSTARATATTRAPTATPTTRAPTTTIQATATIRSTSTAGAAHPTQRPARATSTPRGTPVSGAATATPRPATATATNRPTTIATTVATTATPRPTTTATSRPTTMATTTATARPATSVATATSTPPTATVATGTPSRPPRVVATGAATATRTPTPRPVGTAVTTATRASASGRPPRGTATVPGTPTRVTQLTDASISVYVSICIDPRFIDFGEFGSETDLGPRYLTDIDRSRCRPARSGETRITLTSTYPNYLPAYAQTTSTDADGRMSFVFPAQREQRIGSLHLEGPIPAQDAGVKIVPGRVLVIPLTIVILDPAIGVTGTDMASAGGPPLSGDDSGWLPGVLAIIGLPLALAAARRSGTQGR